MVHVSVRDTDTDSCSVRSDVSVKSVNLYGSPIPENLDSWRNGFIILIRNPRTARPDYHIKFRKIRRSGPGVLVQVQICRNVLIKSSLNVISKNA